MAQRVAVVTGAAGSIGAATAGLLAESGHRVVLTDVDPQVHEVASDLRKAGHATASHVVDLRLGGNDTAIVKFAAEIVGEHGRCDILVNNAGAHFFPADGGKYNVEETTLDHWQTLLDINLTAPFLLCREFLPVMKSNGWGRIVNITSRAARTYIFGSAGYSATKSGLVGLTRTLAGEGGPYGITANCIAPGGSILTTLSRNLSPEMHEQYRQATALKKDGSPEDIAAAVNFLVSDAASYITGVHLDVNGGIFMSA